MTKLEEVQEITRAQFGKLQRQFPGTFELGGCLLVGRHYAHPGSRVLVLGINPGISPSTDLDVGLQQHNFLLDGPDWPRHQYWTNARKFFNSSPALLATVRLATFSLCCPFRTASWSGLSDTLRSSLIVASRPILSAVVRHCQPQLIIVAGVDGFAAMTQILNATLRMGRLLSRGGHSGTYQWSAYETTNESGSRGIVAQVPHFSRANSTAKLHECARWLAELATATTGPS